jgi:phosphopantothenoylcysteine decarboxylase/phosphopantothenate--cysteine ligase
MSRLLTEHGCSKEKGQRGGDKRKGGYDHPPALAQAAQLRGAEVTLITGPTNIAPPAEVVTIPVQTASQMFEETIKRYKAMDTVIMAAAVSDFRPARISPKKIKKA